MSPHAPPFLLLLPHAGTKGCCRERVRCGAALRSLPFGPAQDGFVRLTPCPPALAEASASSFASGDGQSRPAPAALHGGEPFAPIRQERSATANGAPEGDGGACTAQRRPGAGLSASGSKGGGTAFRPCRGTWSEADKSAPGRIGGDAAPCSPSGSSCHTTRATSPSPHRLACARSLALRFRGDTDVRGPHLCRQAPNTTFAAAGRRAK